MKIYRVFDYEEETGCGSTYTSSMKHAKKIAKHMNDPEICFTEFNNDKASIIRALNIASMEHYSRDIK